MAKGLLERKETVTDSAILKKDAQLQRITAQTIDEMLFCQLFECRSIKQMNNKIKKMFEGDSDRYETE